MLKQASSTKWAFLKMTTPWFQHDEMLLFLKSVHLSELSYSAKQHFIREKYVPENNESET